MHAVLARSTFRSQKSEKLTGSEHFWKLRCRKTGMQPGPRKLPPSERPVLHRLYEAIRSRIPPTGRHSSPPKLGCGTSYVAQWVHPCNTTRSTTPSIFGGPGSIQCSHTRRPLAEQLREPQPTHPASRRRRHQARARHRTAAPRPAPAAPAKCTPVWPEAYFEVKSVKKIAGSEHFWKLRCRKSARRCGANHISKSIVYKTDGFRALLEVEMSKKCTPLWREAHFEVKVVVQDYLIGVG